jgi:hypothetical protein
MRAADPPPATGDLDHLARTLGNPPVTVNEPATDATAMPAAGCPAGEVADVRKEDRQVITIHG